MSSRHRLRFLLQEVDLPAGDTFLGRSPECQVTLDDPLVSRRHAKVTSGEDSLIVEDCGSRNGTRVNGEKTAGPLALHDGDRLRLGTVEMVVSVVPVVKRRDSSRSTGAICYCDHCRHPYATDLPLCPACGSPQRTDEPTMSGMDPTESPTWTHEFLIEMLERAVALRRWPEAESTLERLSQALRDIPSGVGSLDAGSWGRASGAAGQLAVELQRARWAAWTIEGCELRGRPPAMAVVTTLAGLGPSELAELMPAVASLGRRMRQDFVSPVDRATLSALEDMVRRGAHGTGVP